MNPSLTSGARPHQGVGVGTSNGAKRGWSGFFGDAHSLCGVDDLSWTRQPGQPRAGIPSGSGRQSVAVAR